MTKGLGVAVDVAERPEDFVGDDNIAQQTVAFLEGVARESSNTPAARAVARAVSAAYTAVHIAHDPTKQNCTHDMVNFAISYAQNAIDESNSTNSEKNALIASIEREFALLRAMAKEMKWTAETFVSAKSLEKTLCALP